MTLINIWCIIKLLNECSNLIFTELIVVYVTCGLMRDIIDFGVARNFAPSTNLQFCHFENVTGLDRANY